MTEGFTIRSLREELYSRLWRVSRGPFPRLPSRPVSDQERIGTDVAAELKIIGHKAADYVLRNKYKDLWGKPTNSAAGRQNGMLRQLDKETDFKHGFHNFLGVETANFAGALLQKLTAERLMAMEGLSPDFREGLQSLENLALPQMEDARENIMSVFRQALAVKKGTTDGYRIEVEAAQLINDIENTVLAINPDKDCLARIFQSSPQDSINPNLPRRG